MPESASASSSKSASESASASSSSSPSASASPSAAAQYTVIDQAAIQIVQGDESKAQIDQSPIQIIQGGNPKVQIDQVAIQVLQLATARNARIDQCVIQLILEPPKGSFWPILLRMLDQQRS